MLSHARPYKAFKWCCQLIGGLVLGASAQLSSAWMQWQDTSYQQTPFGLQKTMFCTLDIGGYVDCEGGTWKNDAFDYTSIVGANYIKIQDSGGGTVCVGIYGTGNNQCWALGGYRSPSMTSIGSKLDSDGDIWMNQWDTDDDNDGVPDTADFAPLDASIFCASGKYWNGSTCTVASAGYYVPDQHSTSQTACANGTYQPLTDQISCNNTSTVVQYCSVYSATVDACSGCASGYTLTSGTCSLAIASHIKNDFDGDGKADVLFLNTTTGTTKYWSDANKTQSIYVGTYSLSYAYEGTGDFDGDGKADLLFVNTSTNATLIWNGAVKTAAIYPGTGAAGYSVAAVCDTDGDGKDDIVWFNPATGSVRIWLDATKAAVIYPGIQNTAYSIVACADFDGDKHADLFWQNATTGANQVWLGGQKGSMMYPGANTDLTVQAVGAGDTDGDGQADMVWYTPSTNSIRVWLGGLKAASNYLGTGASGFTPKAMADYDGDGMVDLLWANDTTLATQIWPAFNKANVIYPGAYPTGFTIQK
jgi:hypothetical protein